MIKNLILFILFCPLVGLGQTNAALWEGYFSFSNIVDIASGLDKVYAASENAVFSYDIDSNDIQKITTIEGLSGESISTLSYSSEFNVILIGYENGLIELYFEESGDVVSVVDILEKESISPEIKGINDFNEVEGLVYISSGFGISVFNLNQLEFGDTYFIGNGGSQIDVRQTVVVNDQIYAACQSNNAIKTANLSNPNLIDFQEWSTIGFGSYVNIKNIDNRIFTVSNNRVLFEIVNNSLVNITSFNTRPLDVSIGQNSLIYTFANELLELNSNGAVISNIEVPEDFDTTFSSGILFNDDFYIGTKGLGMFAVSLPSQEFTSIIPEGPLFNSAYKIEAGRNEVWLSFGEYSTSFNPGPLDARGLSHLQDEQWINIPYDSLFGAKDLNTIALNIFNNNQVFVSSFHSGLLEINDNVPTRLLDDSNSGLESLILPGSDFKSIRVSGLKFDRSGLLWTITSRVNRALKSYDVSTGQWRGFSFEPIIPNALTDELGFSDLDIDDSGTKWIGGFFSGLIAYNENNNGNKIRNINNEEQGMPFSTVRALAVDNRNQVWIGTDFGLRVLFNSFGFLDDPNPSASAIIILEDGIPRELLEDVFITDIKVDGSNNKWVGTLNSGVFYFSPDGQQTIYHFTKDNSPLPSNTINDLSIDASNGKVYMATTRGLVSFLAGGSSPEESLEEAYVYPNPVRPEYNILGFNDLNDITKGIKITGLTEDVNIKITDIEGNLVAEAQSRVNLRASNARYNFAIDGGTAIWNGKNLANNIVASGVYLILISDLDTFETKVLKLLIIR